MNAWPGGTPCVPFVPGRTPGVVVAKLMTLRPFMGSSAICFVVMSAETPASSVLITGAEASTVMDSETDPGILSGNVVDACSDEVDPVVPILIGSCVVSVHCGGIHGRYLGPHNDLPA